MKIKGASVPSQTDHRTLAVGLVPPREGVAKGREIHSLERGPPSPPPGSRTAESALVSQGRGECHPPRHDFKFFAAIACAPTGLSTIF